MLELRRVFTQQPDVSEIAVDDNLFLHAIGFMAALCGHTHSAVTLQFRPSRCDQFTSNLLEIGCRIAPEMKQNSAPIPAVQMFGLTEVRVAPQKDRAKAAALQQCDHLIAICRRAFMTGAVGGRFIIRSGSCVLASEISSA